MKSDPEHDAVVERFHGRCVMCNRPSRIVHEIVPRSSGKSAMDFDNRVVLCYNCHEWAHQVGSLVSGRVIREHMSKSRYAA